jgi:hypothetical protein
VELEVKERGRGFLFPFKEQEAKDIRDNAEIIDRKMQDRINSLRRRSSFFKLNLDFVLYPNPDPPKAKIHDHVSRAGYRSIKKWLQGKF